MNIEQAYAAGFQAAIDDFLKVATLSPAAMRTVAMGGLGAVSGAAGGALSTDKAMHENLPGLDGAYKERRRKRGLIGAGLGAIAGAAGGHGLNVAQDMAQAAKPKPLLQLPAPTVVPPVP